jgi:hypothetical protein
MPEMPPKVKLTTRATASEGLTPLWALNNRDNRLKPQGLNWLQQREDRVSEAETPVTHKFSFRKG